MKKNYKKSKTSKFSKNLVQGFTLLEVLLVLAAIAILAGIVVVALNPGKQIGDTRNAQRRADVNTILNAVYQYMIDNDGNLPAGLDDNPLTSQVLGTASSGLDATCTATATLTQGLNLGTALVPVYLMGIPTDPKTGTDLNTDYYINKDANGRITVGACDPEQSSVISVTR